MRFGRTYARLQIYRVVNRIRLRGRGGRYLGRALAYTGRYLFIGKPRCGRRKVLIVLTTGESRDRIRIPGLRLFASGVEIYAIGIGRVRRRSLLQIATASTHVFNVAARRLVSITRTIKDRICSSPGKYVVLFMKQLPPIGKRKLNYLKPSQIYFYLKRHFCEAVRPTLFKTKDKKLRSMIEASHLSHRPV